jgi:hypothetical protein
MPRVIPASHTRIQIIKSIGKRPEVRPQIFITPQEATGALSIVTAAHEIDVADERIRDLDGRDLPGERRWEIEALIDSDYWVLTILKPTVHAEGWDVLAEGQVPLQHCNIGRGCKGSSCQQERSDGFDEHFCFCLAFGCLLYAKNVGYCCLNDVKIW